MGKHDGNPSKIKLPLVSPLLRIFVEQLVCSLMFAVEIIPLK